MTAGSELCTATLAETGARIRKREVSPVEVTNAELERIAALDGRLHAFLLVTADLALNQAREAEQEIARGRYRGPLHGIPIGLKDLVYTKGIRTTCASRILRDFEPDFDATIVEKLNEAGAVILGKLNLTEFALYGYHPDLDYPRNPWNVDYYAGVSSSGSGVAVAASLCFGAIGSDTGGSIRFPSAACGIVGIKPTFGKISRHGVFPLAHTLDHIGPMARCVADAALMLQVLEGYDARDPSTRDDPTCKYTAELGRGVASMRIGIDRRYAAEGTDPLIAEALDAAAETFRGLGAQLVDVDLTGLDQVCRYWMLTCGVDALLHHGAYYPARAYDYGAVFRSLLDYGARADARDYARGEVLRQSTTALLNHVLTRADVLLLPASPALPMAVKQARPNDVFPPESLHPFFRHTVPLNYSGHPSVTLPNGFAPQGLPLAMQIIGPHAGEAAIIRAAAAYEAATDWHRRPPPGTSASRRAHAQDLELPPAGEIRRSQSRRCGMDG